MRTELEALLIQQARLISDKSKEAPAQLLPDLSYALVSTIAILEENESGQD